LAACTVFAGEIAFVPYRDGAVKREAKLDEEAVQAAGFEFDAVEAADGFGIGAAAEIAGAVEVARRKTA